MIQRVRRTIEERALFSAGDRVLVACSGGPDSAALLHVLVRLAPELRIGLFAATVDHGLRETAAADARLARAQAQALEVPFQTLSVRVRAGSTGLQAEARTARYRALREEGKRVGATAIAVGHTLDDQAETVISRLLRSASVPGLAGIEPSRADGVVRPLIDCRRADVRRYVATRAISCADDPSNLQPRFERVRIRQQILPRLLQENPRLVEQLAELADDARALAAWAALEAQKVLAEARCPGGLMLAPLRAAPEALVALTLGRWLEETLGEPPRRAHIRALCRALDRPGSEVLLPREQKVAVKTDCFLLVERSTIEG